MEPERWSKRILEIVQKCYDQHIMLQFERFDFDVFKVILFSILVGKNIPQFL